MLHVWLTKWHGFEAQLHTFYLDSPPILITYLPSGSISSKQASKHTL